MRKVLVVVPARRDFNGFWAIGRHFPAGKTEVEVDEKKLAELREDEKKGFLAVVMLDEEQAKAADPAKPAPDAGKAKAK